MKPLSAFVRAASNAPVQDWPIDYWAAHASHRAPWRPYVRRA